MTWLATLETAVRAVFSWLTSVAGTELPAATTCPRTVFRLLRALDSCVARVLTWEVPPEVRAELTMPFRVVWMDWATVWAWVRACCSTEFPEAMALARAVLTRLTKLVAVVMAVCTVFNTVDRTPLRPPRSEG